MTEIFEIDNIKFYKEDFQDNINEFEDLFPIIEELSPTLKCEKIECVDLNDCCGKTKENYFVEIQGFLTEDDDFITKEEIENNKVTVDTKTLDLFVIRLYKCTSCNKWIIDILE